MICYRDMTFCTAKDCPKIDCPRNIRNKEFCPDEFWKDKIAWASFQNHCADYQKEVEK